MWAMKQTIYKDPFLFFYRQFWRKLRRRRRSRRWRIGNCKWMLPIPELGNVKENRYPSVVFSIHLAWTKRPFMTQLLKPKCNYFQRLNEISCSFVGQFDVYCCQFFFIVSCIIVYLLRLSWETKHVPHKQTNKQTNKQNTWTLYSNGNK